MRPIWQVLILWLWISLQFLNTVPTQNEEMYFALAKQFLQPDWAPWSFHFSEFPGTRLLFQYISGFFLEFLSFESFAFWSRAVAFFLLLLPLNNLFRYFKLNWIAQLVILQLFIYFDQSYFAGGWIFQGFEAKTLSYILIFISLNLLLRKNYTWAIFTAALATSFHILVGGWYTLVLGFYLILQRENLRYLLWYALLYIILTGPMVYYLATEILLNSRKVIDGVNLDQVYVFLRNPHHTGIFQPLSEFTNRHLPGIIGLLISVVISLFIRKSTPVNLKYLFWCFSGLTILNLIIGAFDTTGAFLKFYPFRPAVFALLTFLMLAFVWICENMIPPHGYRFVLVLFLFICLPMFASGVQYNVRVQQRGVVTEEQQQLYDYVKTISEEGDVFYFYEHTDWDNDISFIRKTSRERFFVFKYVPSGGEKLYDWYRRYQFKKEVKENLQHLFSNHAYQIDYLISKQQLANPNLKFVGSSGDYSVYQVLIANDQ